MENQSPQKIESNIRDHFANERTFLAWVRTGIALMAFGFVVVKFSLFIRQLSLLFNKTNRVVFSGKGNSVVVGILLVIIGAAMTLLAYFRYKNIEKQLLSSSYRPSSTLGLLITLSVVIASIILVIYLFPGINQAKE